MKFGVIGDIHGNIDALKAIVRDLNQQGIDQYLIAGDLISDCHAPNEVLDFIQILDAVVIKGNREQYILDYLDGLLPAWNGLHQMASVVWTANHLSQRNVDYIKALPMNQMITIEDKKIFLTHGSPTDLNEHLYPDKEKERLKKATDVAKSDILICAHSHHPWKTYAHQTTIFNPGAAGVHFNEQSGAEYAILEVSTTDIRITHHVASYDLEAFEVAMRESSLYKEAPVWADLIIQSIKTGENANIAFIRKILANYDIKEFIPNDVWEEVAATLNDI